MTTRLNTRISVSEPGDVLAALPHLLGFHPEDSFVLVTLHDLAVAPRFGVTMRLDLPCPMQARAFGEFLLHGPLRQQDAEAVLLIVVGERADEAACAETCEDTCQESTAEDAERIRLLEEAGPPMCSVIEVVKETLQHNGIVPAHAVWTSEIREGAPWRCYDDVECTGTVADPKESPIGAVLAARGAVTFGSKDELRELVAPESPEVVARWSAKLDALAEDDLDEEVPDRVARDVRAVHAAIRRSAAGSALTEGDLQGVLLAVSDNRVRDIVLGTALGEHARAAEELWLSLVRKAPDAELPEVAVLLAFSAYLRGEGGLASVALERAERVQPDHRLGVLLRQAMEAGIPPAELSAIARNATEDARLVLDEEGAC
ncbi:DUF4192 domain-containing protein [Saccharopolyspora griseoalba]|uniref:DUF4192 domain-containing protein n=1 Tax=Saccharopolyspora griseoalba TaxID=1431848 RepID=A0ABW2LSA0_9PSEU